MIHSCFALLLAPALAACNLLPVPESPAVVATTTQASGRITGMTMLPDALKPVYNGKTRGVTVPLVSGAFRFMLPDASAMNAIALPITGQKFGDDADCAGTLSYTNPDVKVVFLTYSDLFRNGTLVGYAAGGEVQGDTVNTYSWIYATGPTEVRLQESCVKAGKQTTDTVHLQLAAGWNSALGQRMTAANSVMDTWYTKPTGEVPFVLVGTGTAPSGLR